jgi:hypothetical protein
MKQSTNISKKSATVYFKFIFFINFYLSCATDAQQRCACESDGSGRPRTARRASAGWSGQRDPPKAGLAQILFI